MWIGATHTHAHSHTSSSINVNSGFILFQTPTWGLVRDKPSPTGLVQRVKKKNQSLHLLGFLVTANVGTYQDQAQTTKVSLSPEV